MRSAEFRPRPWKMLIGLFHPTDADDDEDDNDELTCQHEAGRKEGEEGKQLFRKEIYMVIKQNLTRKCIVFR